MTGESVLIAAYSGRALAEAARRAGYVPLVVDAFGDLDMRAAAEQHVQIPNAVRNGFMGRPLFAALDDLIARSETRPIGIVLGSGFEDRPKLIEALDRRYRLLGTKAATVAEVKDPRRFFPLLKQLGIAHPETNLTHPGELDGWITKRTGGSRRRPYPRSRAALRDPMPRSYYQRRLKGTPHSVFAVACKGGVALELSRQWTAPSSRKPYRYGGAVIVDYAETAAQDRMISAAAALIELLDPAGLLSFDFLVEGEQAYLLEINPRPGATIEIFDDQDGNLFRAHVEAGLGNELWQRRNLPDEAGRAAAVLYADRGALTIGEIDWPEWAADKPAPGTLIAAEQPLASVRADGASADEAERLARSRLSTLADLVYTSSKKS